MRSSPARNDIIVAGGMESMTNAPYLVPKARGGFRMGHATMVDHMFMDGLEDAYDKGRLMGTFAEDCADKYAFTREAQDEVRASTSLSRALAANNDGTFAWEIAPVTVHRPQGRIVIDKDEQPAKANAGQDSDAEARVPQGRHGDRGELELDLRRRRGAGADAPLEAEKRGLKPLAVIVAHATHAQEPGLVHHRPVGAIEKLLREDRLDDRRMSTSSRSTRRSPSCTMAAMKEHDIPHDRVNVHGGACALGHPIGASGARIIVTLIGALRKHGQEARRGEPVHRRRRSDGDGDRAC